MQRRRLERARERARRPRSPATHARARGRQRQGRRRQVVGHREPRRRARGARASPSACSTPTSGASASRACSASTAGSAAPTARSTRNDVQVAEPATRSARRARSRSCRWASSSTTRAPRSCGAGLILTKALEQFLTDVRWGDLDYLLIDMPPGTGDVQMGLARLLPQAEMLVVTTPALAAQKVAARVADMARRSYLKVVGVVENMSEFVAPDGAALRALRRGRRRGARRGDRRAARRVGSRSSPRCPRAATPARPVALGDARQPGRRARSTTLAARIVDELLPPIEMAGCTARIFELATPTWPRARAPTADPAPDVQATFQADFGRACRSTLPSAFSFSRCACTCQPAASTSSGGEVVVGVERRRRCRVILAGPLLQRARGSAARAALRCARYSSMRAFGSSITSPWPGAMLREPQLLEPFERREVLRHVAAAAGAHDRVHAVEHGVAGEQDPLLLEEEAQVVRARGPACAAPRARTRCPRSCRRRRSTRSSDDVGVLVALLAEREHLGAGRLHEARGRRASGRDACA